jgi:predicted nucleic-acid-binding protein
VTRSDAMSESVERGLVFVDTNVFLRFLTDDMPAQAAAVEALFRRAATGEAELITNAMVLAELVWVLESYYHLGRPEVQERAMAVACMDGLTVPEVDVVIDALLAYGEAKVDFIDAYNACWMRARGLSRVATFDKRHYSRLQGMVVHPF